MRTRTPLFFALLVVVPGAQAQQIPDSSAADSAIAARLGYRRSVRTARVLGAVVPGAGHLYAGEWLKSYPFLVSATGGIVVGNALYTFDRCTFDWRTSCRPGVPLGARLAGVTMVGAGVATWIMSSVDAGRAVERQRARRVRAAAGHGLGVQPTVGPCGADRFAWCVGVDLTK